MLFQELALWSHMTVEEQVRFALPAGFPDAKQQVARTLSEVRLGGLAGAYPTELSGGERQRVAWARAVVAQPRLLLLDEPLTSLDPRLKAGLVDAIEAFGQRQGHTMIVATHDSQLADCAGRRRLALDASSA